MKKTQFGRTLNEMLCTLAIIGVLSIAGMIGLQYAMANVKANAIVQDAFLAYMETDDRQDLTLGEWSRVNFNSESGRDFFVTLDEDGDRYVKVEAIEEKVCDRLLKKRAENMAFYTVENERFETCEEENTMIFALNGLSAMGKDCVSSNNCSADTYCRTDEEICVACDEGYIVNESRDGCILDCGEETFCQLDEEMWCCPDNKVCDVENKDCKNFTGFCLSEVKEQENAMQSDCSYTIKEQVNVMKSDCSYTIKEQVNVMESDCSMTISVTGEVATVSVTPCPAGQYCYVAYNDDKCSDSSGAEKTGTIYGACHNLSMSAKGCPVTSWGDVMIVESDTCGENQYCYVAYDDSTCKTGSSADKSGTIYGACHSLTLSAKGCPVISWGGVMKVEHDTCGENQYCYVAYDDSTCKTGSPAEKSGTIYGACHNLSMSAKGCPVTSWGDVMSQVIECPKSQYCYVRWSDNACTDAGASHSGPIYGACLEKYSNSASCDDIVMESSAEE